MNKLIFLLLGFTLCIACKNDVKNIQNAKKQTIFANFFVRYLQNESALKAEATFREGKDNATAIPIEFSEGVKFDQQLMKFKNIKDQLMRYQIESRTQYQGKFDFEVVDENIRNFKVALEMSGIKSFQVDEPIAKSKGMLLQWEGDPLRKDEKLVLLFSDKNNKAYSCTVNGPTEESKTHISPDALPDIVPGKGQLYLVKKKTSQLKQKRKQINSNLEFYTDSKAITVE